MVLPLEKRLVGANGFGEEEKVSRGVKVVSLRVVESKVTSRY